MLTRNFIKQSRQSTRQFIQSSNLLERNSTNGGLIKTSNKFSKNTILASGSWRNKSFHTTSIKNHAQPIQNSMRALVYHDAHDIRYNDSFPIPKITKPDDVVIKIAFCGICGTDLHEYEETHFFKNAASENGDKISGKKLPLIPGHEFSGIVHSVGEKVVDLKPGDHIVVEATGHCSDRQNYFNEDDGNFRSNEELCTSCELGYHNTCKDLNFLGLGVDNGGLAEYTKYSQQHVLKINNKIPLDVAALIEPLSVVWHAIELSGFKPGEDAVVLGAGPIGLATIIVLQAFGASKIVVSEPASIRREQGEFFGAIGFNPNDYGDESINELKKKSNNGKGFAKSFDCSGIPITYSTSIHALRAHGTACNVAIWPHRSVAHFVMDLTVEEKQSLGSLGYTRNDFEGVINAINRGSIQIEKLKQFITGRVGLKSGVTNGFLELIEHKDKHIKILISPDLFEK